MLVVLLLVGGQSHLICCLGGQQRRGGGLPSKEAGYEGNRRGGLALEELMDTLAHQRLEELMVLLEVGFVGHL